MVLYVLLCYDDDDKRVGYYNEAYVTFRCPDCDGN